MNISVLGKPLLLLISLACIGMLAVGLYLQLQLEMLPCPLCILQRYAFALVAVSALLGVAMSSRLLWLGAALTSLAASAGAGIAARHLWVKAHPSVSCGIDPLETSLNEIITARWFPALFQADGLCTTDYEPILGLSIPAWALLWFVVFAVLGAMIAVMSWRRR